MNPNEKSYKVLKAIQSRGPCGIDGIIEETVYIKQEVENTIASLISNQFLWTASVEFVGHPESRTQLYSANHITERGKKMLDAWQDDKSS